MLNYLNRNDGRIVNVENTIDRVWKKRGDFKMNSNKGMIWDT